MLDDEFGMLDVVLSVGDASGSGRCALVAVLCGICLCECDEIDEIDEHAYLLPPHNTP